MRLAGIEPQHTFFLTTYLVLCGITEEAHAGVQEKTMKKIRKEVELMGSIQDCGNVVGLHGVYEDDVQVYVVMELCSGGDLERVLEVSCCMLEFPSCVSHHYFQLSRLLCCMCKLVCHVPQLCYQARLVSTSL